MGLVWVVDKYMSDNNRSVGFDRVSDLVLSKPMTVLYLTSSLIVNLHTMTPIHIILWIGLLPESSRLCYP
jgi:hypothetical protein